MTLADEALLAALESLRLPVAPPSKPQAKYPGQDRLAWHLAPKKGSLHVDVFRCLDTPKGWREGDRIPVKDLLSQGLDPRERSACEALRLWSREARGLPIALLAALEGHTRLSWASESDYAGTRVALERELCALEIRENTNGWRLNLTQGSRESSANLRLEGDRLLFTIFGPVHQQLEELLGDGQDVARALGSRLSASLGRLLPHIPLLTDLTPEPMPSELQPDRTLCLWCRGGRERLDLHLRMRLGLAIPLSLPGEGARMIVAGSPANRTLRHRDLTLENHRAEQIKALLPASAKALSQPLSWRIEGRETIAIFLAELRELGSRIRIEGVPGMAPSLPVKLSLRDLEMTIRGEGDPLNVDGSLLGRPLVEWMPQLRTTARFLEWEDGRLLDLSGLPGLKGLAAWGQASGNGLRLPRAAAPLLRSLGCACGAEQTPEALPTTFHGELRAYQFEGFRWMAHLLDAGLGACLADDMGLGKTVQTAAILAHRASLGPALVVAPTSVILNWQAELTRFTPGLRIHLLAEGDRRSTLERLNPHDIVLATYGQLLGEAEGLRSIEWSTLVLDEAHAIKNPETQRAQISRQLRAKARLALTGTPVENHPAELASLMGWLLPEVEARFASASDLETLRLLSAPFILRRRKSEVLQELPPRTDLTVPVELDPIEAAFHQDLLEHSRAEALAGSTVHLFAVLMKLRRACGHPSLVDGAYTGPGAKVDLLLERLEILLEEGHRSLVFSQFTDLLDLVQARLRQSGIPFLRLDGSLPAKRRQREVEAFQSGEASIFLISLRAGGMGLNLTAADDVFHLDPWWNPAVEDQASDRAHRMGRTRPVTVHRLITAGTIEERILALHDRKRAMIEAIMEGRSEPTALDRADLENLLG
jgi:superfamily II DNA or RNA helicase